jgi:hypothetical protein
MRVCELRGKALDRIEFALVVREKRIRHRRRCAKTARVGTNKSSCPPTTILVVILAKAGIQLGMTTRGTDVHRQVKHLFRLRR